MVSRRDLALLVLATRAGRAQEARAALRRAQIYDVRLAERTSALTQPGI